MRKVRFAAVAVLGILLTSTAFAAGYTYSKTGAPVFPNFKLHVTTYAQIAAALGPPIKAVGFDQDGNPSGAAFLIPGTGAGGVAAWQCVFVFAAHNKYNGVTCNPTTPVPGSK